MICERSACVILYLNYRSTPTLNTGRLIGMLVVISDIKETRKEIILLQMYEVYKVPWGKTPGKPIVG